jgi:translation initiation factor 3 subunit B
MSPIEKVGNIDDLAAEAEELDGYFSDTPLDLKPNYPVLRESFDNALIITNLPKVNEAKIERLTKAITKFISRIGTLVTNPDNGYKGIYMPYSEENASTLGFCFVEYETAEEAKNAVNVLQEYKFDKNHILAVMRFNDALRLRDIQETEFVEPKPAPFTLKPNATTWLQDPNQRDSFVIRQGRETVVMWNDGKNPPVIDYDGSREKEAGVSWCEYYCHWSPKGSYLATLVPSKGVILWSGEKYEKTARLPSPGVEFVLFSPQENYILTCNNRRDDPNAIRVFSIQTEKLLRVFPLYPSNFDTSVPPPPFQWSYDDAYLARIGKDLVSIYETPSMKLLDRRSLAADGIHEFQWSPKANILAYWVSL